jgi:hypothetical protein
MIPIGTAWDRVPGSGTVLYRTRQIAGCPFHRISVRSSLNACFALADCPMQKRFHSLSDRIGDVLVAWGFSA